MKMKTAAVSLMAALVVTALLSGCASGSRVVEAHRDSRNVTGDDWIDFARSMSTSIAQNGVLARYAGTQGFTVIALSDFNNKTRMLDLGDQKDIMYNEIKKAFVNTGKIQVNMELCGTGGSPDSMLQKLKGLTESEDYAQETTQGLTGRALAPRLLLYGEFIAKRTFDDSNNEVNDFFCNCELRDTQTRGTVWTDQFRIKKVK